MVAATWLARRRDLHSQMVFDRLLGACAMLRPSKKLPAFGADEILAHLAVDKKRRGGRNLWILPQRVGGTVVRDDITQKETRAAVAFVTDWLTPNSHARRSRPGTPDRRSVR